MRRRTSPARSGAPGAPRRSGSSAPPPRCATDPGGCWVAEDEHRHGSASSRPSAARRCGASRRTPCCRGCQGRGIGKPLLAAALTHGRGCLRGHALGLVPDSEGGPASTGWRASPCTRRCTWPAASTAAASRWSSRCARAPPRDVDLMDSIDRRDPRRRARPRPRADAGLVAVAGRPTPRPGRATSTSTTRPAVACWRPPTGAPRPRLLWAALARAPPGTVAVAPRHRGQRVGGRRRARRAAGRCTRRATSPCAG